LQAAQEAEQLRRQLEAVTKQLAREEQAASRQLQALANKGQRATNEARDAVVDVERRAQDQRSTQISVGLVSTMLVLEAHSVEPQCIHHTQCLIAAPRVCNQNDTVGIYVLHNPH
jgi:hypothetical protein